MSHYDYQVSKQLVGLDAPFYALIMAAMRQADTINGNFLAEVYPHIWAELQARYEAPGGWLPEDGNEIPEELRVIFFPDERGHNAISH